MEERIKILLVEDDKVDQMAFERFVERENLPYDYAIAGSISEARDVLTTERFDIALIDYLLGDGTAFDLFDEIGDIPIIVITGTGDEAIAVQAMKSGAYDYLIKDLQGNYLVILPVTVEGALRHRRAEDELRRYREHLEELVEERAAELIRVNEQLLAEIAERKRAEEALQEYSERLEEMVEQRTQELRDTQERLIRKEKMAVLGQLAGGVGHELRNPLGVISNAIYFLQMTLAEADETTSEYLGIISSEVRCAEKIVSGLLDFSRTRLPDREKIAVSDLVAQVLQRQPPPRDVEVTIKISSDLPPVFVDPRQIGQVLGNLVTNAYQAMPDGGRLMIHVSEGEGIGRHGDTGTGRPGDDLPITPSPCLRVSISDTGCGISEENLEKIFEPLFTTKAKGIGLGLPISRNLVEGNGGSIEAESEMGKGSTFTVRLGTGDRELGTR